MSARVSLVAVCLILVSCTGTLGETDVVTSPTGGDDVLFCNLWPEVRQVLMAGLTGDPVADSEGSIRDWAVRLENEVAGYDTIVPAAISSEWNRAKAAFDKIADLQFTVGYNLDYIRPEHIEMVFGSAGPTPAVADAEAAMAAIDVWAAGSCGDFCSWWADLVDVVNLDADLRTDIVAQTKEQLTVQRSWLTIGDLVAPEPISAEWQTARSIKGAYLDMLVDLDFALDWDDPQAQAADTTRYMGRTMTQAKRASDSAIEAIRSWAEENCDQEIETVAGSGPGRLTINLTPDPAIANSTVLVALLPAGTNFSSVRSIVDYAAGACTAVQDTGPLSPLGDLPAEEILSRLEDGDPVAQIAADLGLDVDEFVLQWNLDEFGIDTVEVIEAIHNGYTMEEIADRMQFHLAMPVQEAVNRPGETLVLQPIDDDREYRDEMCQFQERQAIVDPGDYELFVGAYEGNPGDWKFYASSPRACTQVSVTIGGNTTIDMPPLGPCSVSPVGNASEIARRNPPLLEGDSTLQVRLLQGFTTESPHGAFLEMVLLPRGTTLNDVGRGTVWPSGGIRLQLQPENTVNLPAVSGVVPIMAYPSTFDLVDLPPWEFEENGSWDASLPEPVALDSGEYVLVAQRILLQRPDDDEDAIHSCAMTNVTVQGETVVDLPEFGECP